MQFQGQHILTTKQFDKDSLLSLFDLAAKMEKVVEKGKSELLAGKVMSTIFYEPSTRTRFSFETAMLRLGGGVVSNSDMMATSSFKKKESLADTGKVLSKMVDVIVMRHPEPGSVSELADYSEVPVINAGDGSSEHPTQGLLDLYTIWKKYGKLDGLKIGMIGDLKYGRVPHSQCDLLKHFDVELIFVSPEALKMPEGIRTNLIESGHKIIETENLQQVISEMDVIGMTRVQQERFSSEAEYKKYEGAYILDGPLMKIAKDEAIVIHPLPRVEEIAKEVDFDPRAEYFNQVSNGVYVRMALLLKVLGIKYE